MLKTFAGHVSLSVQQTLYAMAESALEAVPSISEIELTMPNKHCILIDLERFGQENPNEIFVPRTSPRASSRLRSSGPHKRDPCRCPPHNALKRSSPDAARSRPAPKLPARRRAPFSRPRCTRSMRCCVAGWKLRACRCGPTPSAICAASIPAPTTENVSSSASHLDTVPNAGAFDGILGVVLGVALIEELRGEHLPFAIEIVGFSEEEGVRFGKPYLGSMALTGSLR